MKWPWTVQKHSAEHKREILEEVRQERGKLAVTVVNLERATIQLDEIVRRSIADLNRGRS